MLPAKNEFLSMFVYFIIYKPDALYKLHTILLFI